MLRIRNLGMFFVFLSALYCSAFAIGGIGIQWGQDFSMQMDDKTNEKLVFNQLKLSIPNYDKTISGANIPVYVSRTDWERKLFNLGVKFYIDIIPVIDALEFSSNYGVWEYKGVIKYPTSIAYSGNPSSPVGSVTYAEMPITLDNLSDTYLGIKNTPYMKLNFDLTVRKYLVQFPKPLKTFRLYGGGGASLIFSTPVLSSKLVQDALGSQLNTALSQSELGSSLFGNEKVMKKVLDEITSQMMTPHWGCHLDLGVMIKLPVIPLGFYVDGKYVIPFEDLDDEVDVGGTGFILNAGVSLSI